MTQPVGPKPQDIFPCPGCGKLVNAEFYVQHINGDQQNAAHTLHVYSIKGVGETVVPQTPPGTKHATMWQIPYLGRVRADTFIAQALFWMIIGALLSAHELHLI